MYALAYDTAIVEELKHGDGNEGVIVSVIGFTMKAGNAVGMMLSGMALSQLVFDAELAVQSAETVAGIKLVYVLVPTVGLLIGMATFWKYSLTEDVFIS